MAEVRGTFGSNAKTSGKLHEMLNDVNLTPEKLFSINNITGDINQNIQTFLKFCKKRRQFTTHMLKICFNSTYQQLQNDNVKKVAQYTIQILTNDEDSLTDFLFAHPYTKTQSQIQQKLTEEGSTNIQSQAQRLFSQAPSKQISAWQKQEDVFNKYQIIKLTLEQLQKQDKNQTCLGYINKLYSSLLRRQGNLFLQFLKQNPQYLTILSHNLNYGAIGNIIALTLSCEDKSGQYKHEQLKKQIFKIILQYGFNNIQNTNNFEGFMQTIQQILNSTKQSYYQYFQDFKRCANILVCQQILRKFYNLLQKNQYAFQNASRYLEHIIKRINSQTQQHDYYRQSNNTEPTMKFQHTFFYSQLTNLVQLLSKAKNYRSNAKVLFLGFLINLMKNMQKNQINIPAEQIFKKLTVHYQAQKTDGIVKNYLYQLLKNTAKKLKQSQTKQIVNWLINTRIQQQNLVNVFNNHTNLKSNSNSTICYLLSILFQIQNKQNTFLSNYTAKNKINLNDMYQKYNTKLAQEDQSASSPIYDEFQLSFKLNAKTKMGDFVGNSNASIENRVTEGKNKEQKIQQIQKQKDNQKQVETQVVGKNSVVIPVLNLPGKIQNNIKITIQEEEVQQVKVPSAAQLSRQALIRDLKNTKFDLPLKLKSKKVQQIQNKQEQPLKTQIKKQQVVQQKRDIEPKPESSTKAQEKPKQTQKTPKTDLSSVNPQQQKYFIKHLMLF